MLGGIIWWCLGLFTFFTFSFFASLPNGLGASEVAADQNSSSTELFRGIYIDLPSGVQIRLIQSTRADEGGGIGGYGAIRVERRKWLLVSDGVTASITLVAAPGTTAKKDRSNEARDAIHRETIALRSKYFREKLGAEIVSAGLIGNGIARGSILTAKSNGSQGLPVTDKEIQGSYKCVSESFLTVPNSFLKVNGGSIWVDVESQDCDSAAHKRVVNSIMTIRSVNKV